MARLTLRASLRFALLRGASSQTPAVVVVDGRRSLELVRAELALCTAAHASRGVQLFAAGRQGITIALRAAAALRSESSGHYFTLSDASGKQLANAGLEALEPTSSAEETEGVTAGRGFCLSFPPRASDGEIVSDHAPIIQHVMRVGPNSRLVPLAKAIATTVSRLPEGHAAAVETVLFGKSKNRWTRTHRMAMAVAKAHGWQESPSPNLRHTARPFQCLASQFGVSELPRGSADAGTPEKADADESGERVVMDVLRLLLLPTRSADAS